MRHTLIVFSLILVSFASACSPSTATPTAVAGTEIPAIASPTSIPPTQALVPINVCYTATTGTQAVTWYAYEQQLFQKYGLIVELTYINSGSKAVTALLAGSVDICQLAGSAVVNAVAAGQDAVMIAGLYNLYPASLMVTADIHTPQDLVGKALAITQPGSSTDVGTRLALAQLGLVPDTDVALLALGEESIRMAAMENGQVAGTLLTSPDTLFGREKGYFEMVNLGALNIAYQHTGIGTTRHYIQSHFSEVENFMKAILEAIAMMKNDPEGTKAVLAQYLLLDMNTDAAALEDAYQTLILKGLEEVPFPTLPGIQTLIDYQSASNASVGLISPDQVVDLSILNDLQDSGFIAQLNK